MKPTQLIVSSLFLTASVTFASPKEISEPPADARIPLAAAVNAFNKEAAQDPFAKDQPALTEDAVIAAMRWEMLDRKKLLVSDETFRTLGEIITTRSLPKGFDLERLRGYEPNDQVTFDVWSVRLRIPGGTLPGGTTCIMIQENMIRSRVIGEEERKVIHKWEKKEQERGGIGSMERVEWMEQYHKERDAAAAIDRGNKK
jgi:hypothetical protein